MYSIIPQPYILIESGFAQGRIERPDPDRIGASGMDHNIAR
jgi:hypothetical protein